MTIKNVKILSAPVPNYFSPIGYFLKLSHKTYGKSKDNYNWLPQKTFLINHSGLTDDFLNNLCKKILEEKVDILGISFYSWNNVFFKRLCSIIKQHNKDIVIIAGGPEVDAHRNKDFFINFPCFDYAIYGDGEKAFTLLLDHLAGFEVELINLVDSTGLKYQHEVFKEESILKDSPYLEFQDELKKDYFEYDTELSLFKNKESISDIDRSRPPTLIWETTKGCPYQCSFCDWSSGLHNKVRVWGLKNVNYKNDPNWKKELNLFTDIGIKMILWSNPNVGLSRQDVEIVNHWCQLKDSGLNPPMTSNLQLAKINKDLTYELWEKMHRSGISEDFKLDLQDLDPIVLSNVDRPQIPWNEHKPIIKRIIDRNPLVFKHIKSKANFIWGLPGQTLAHWDNNFLETTSLGIRPLHFLFENLPNSPINNPEYQEKFKIKIEKLYIVNFPISKNCYDLNDIEKINLCGESNVVVSTYSLDKESWYKGAAKEFIYFAYRNIIDEKPYIYVKYFSFFNNIIKSLYSDFLKHKMICNASNPFYFLNAGFNEIHKKNIEKILSTIYKVKI